ncbi:MAG: winged-helix domain-containing protein [Candidatus Methanosuratincola sp.]|nr:winged-helix domain-containing protein [Candidatus Methanosuratincola sp.]
MEDAILSLLRQKKKGLSVHQLAGHLRLRGRELAALRRALNSLCRRGAISRKRDSYLALADETVIRGEFLPSSETALSELSGIMNDTLVSFSNITGESLITGPASEDADKILKEAAAVAESRLKDKLPGAGTDLPLTDTQ